MVIVVLPVIQLKIYGTRSCKSGKQMKTANRVFIVTLKEAVPNG